MGQEKPLGVSIHAPVKGATANSSTLGKHPKGFNPRTREGCDPLGLARKVESPDVSIHAPVKGATAHSHVDQLNPRVGFQSTHP